MKAPYCDAKHEFVIVLAAAGEPCPERVAICDDACVFRWRMDVPAAREAEITAAKDAVWSKLAELEAQRKNVNTTAL